MKLLLPLLLACSGIAHAYPLDPAQTPVMDVDLPNSVNKYPLAYDSGNDVGNSNNVVYYQPKFGQVATNNGMPLVGLAYFTRNGVKRGFLNMQFEFAIPTGEREALFGAIRRAGYHPLPFPFKKTTVVPMVPGWDSGIKSKLCSETVDEMTGQKMVVCDTMIDQMKYSENGPTLGENIAVSVILSEQGAAGIGQLLNGGNAFQVELKARYDAAAPAYTAKITVNYEKLTKSFASFAAYHNGACVDVQVSAFWHKEAMCDKGRESECSIKVTYTDQNGRTVNNMYTDSYAPEEAKKFYDAIEGLRTRFENEMLVKETPASVDKSVNAMFTLRADYREISRNIHFELERKSLGGTHEKETSMTGTIACIQVADDGSVNRKLTGDCGLYWRGELSGEEYVEKLKTR